MKTVAIFTTSRAEFGLLSNLLCEIDKNSNLNYILFAGGAHHLKSQGYSKKEINEKGFKVVDFDFMIDGNSEKDLLRSLSIETEQLSNIFSEYKFDFVMVLGDRIELLPIVQTAIIFGKPLIHLHGGEITEGAWDDQVRHMITKASHLHFCASSEYERNILSMGEEKWRIHNVGAIGIDTIIRNNTIPKEELFAKYSLDIAKPTIMLTYHPVTLELDISTKTQIENLFKALHKFDFQVIITAPNIDLENTYLFEKIEKEIAKNKDYHFIRSLGISNYQSILKYVEFVIGNSSSGIIEVPFYRIPTVNIGDRQKGRIRHKSVIEADYKVESIIEAINKAISPSFRESIKDMDFKFGDGHAVTRILKILEETDADQKLLKKKLECYHG